MSNPQSFQPVNNSINAYNFGNLVPLVNLDQSGGYFGEYICKICNTGFTFSVDTRILPCKHGFHGQCVYDFLITGNNKFCPVCRKVYL